MRANIRSVVTSLNIMAIFLVSGYISAAAAQGTSINNLPTCAINCATSAASSVGCQLADSDVSCLCEHASFKPSVTNCAQSACTVEDRGAVTGVLDVFCAGIPATTMASSTPPQLPHSSTSSTSSTSSHFPASSTSQHSSTGTDTPVQPTKTPPGPGTAAPSGSAAGVPSNPITGNSVLTSSAGGDTSLTIQTLTLPQTSSTDSVTSSSIARVHVSGYGGFLVQFAIGWTVGIFLIFH